MFPAGQGGAQRQATFHRHCNRTSSHGTRPLTAWRYHCPFSRDWASCGQCPLSPAGSEKLAAAEVSALGALLQPARACRNRVRILASGSGTHSQAQWHHDMDPAFDLLCPTGSRRVLARQRARVQLVWVPCRRSQLDCQLADRPVQGLVPRWQPSPAPPSRLPLPALLRHRLSGFWTLTTEASWMHLRAATT